ncbi:S1 family peptidase [Saccharopolyspora thermophila]|uniref:S1 family peptidase n=1 Tax=Saccharopolyspora thermophila TaxID=89367 RepID=UPI001E5C3B2D|nr:S1 family peptidase [Saccharopolyspora subtropica]
MRDRAVIRPIKRAVEDQLLDLPGVTAVDIGEKHRAGRRTGQQVIVVSVVRKKPLGQLGPGTRIPGDVFGIPTDVVEEEPVLQHIHCGRNEPLAPRQRREERAAAVRGGSGIAPYRTVHLAPPAVDQAGQYRRVGTLGALVTGAAPTASMMGLTTFDVACLDDAWAVGDRMVDPEGGRVHGDLARAALSGRVDAAAVAIAPGLETSSTIDGIGPVTGHGTAYPGERIRKNGFGTGVTHGVVTSVDATVRIDHGEALGVRVLREQIRIVATDLRFCGPGDAGAAVLDPGGRVLGLVVAGACGGAVGFASPVADVLAELDVELCTEPQRVRV